MMREIREQLARTKDTYPKCNKCGTEKNWTVVGYSGEYCKCEADRLGNTPLAQNQMKLIRQLCGLDMDTGDIIKRRRSK